MQGEETVHGEFFASENVTAPKEWLHIGGLQTEVKHKYLTIEQKGGSYNASLLFVIIERIGCGDIIHDTFKLKENYPYAKISDRQGSYHPYYPNIVIIECEQGYTSEYGQLSCEMDATWKWIGDPINCQS